MAIEDNLEDTEKTKKSSRSHQQPCPQRRPSLSRAHVLLLSVNVSLNICTLKIKVETDLDTTIHNFINEAPKSYTSGKFDIGISEKTQSNYCILGP